MELFISLTIFELFTAIFFLLTFLHLSQLKKEIRTLRDILINDKVDDSHSCPEEVDFESLEPVQKEEPKKNNSKKKTYVK